LPTISFKIGSDDIVSFYFDLAIALFLLAVGLKFLILPN